MGDPQELSVQQRQRPHHLARHAQENHHADRIGIVGGIVQERVVEQNCFAVMPETFLALFDLSAIIAPRLRLGVDADLAGIVAVVGGDQHAQVIADKAFPVTPVRLDMRAWLQHRKEGGVDAGNVP